MRQLLSALLLFVLLVAVALLTGLLYLRWHADGFSARTQPTRIESALAKLARRAAMPASAKNLPNPVVDSPEVEHEAMAHFADHCAVCHGNDGSGDTMFGRGLYPKPPDLRLPATQNLTDGELFSIIENGVRLTGMPAFGMPGGDTTDSWKLVHFLRHLPRIAPSEVEQMQQMNPKTPDEIQEEKQEQDFLNGGSTASATK